MKLTMAVAALVATTALAIVSQPVEARALKVQTSQNSGISTFNFITEKWAPKLAKMTDGAVKIDLLPIGSVVPYRDTLNATSMGILDGDLTAIGYFSGLDPALALMGDLVAGYDNPDQMQMFCEVGGGKELLQKIYDEINPGVHVVGCGPYNKEALVSRVPIRAVADFQGKKVRSPEGLPSDLFARMEASPVSLPQSEVFTALDKGVVDASDASAYSNNQKAGMHEIARYPIYPGIHSMSMLQFTLNQELWDGLSEAQKAIVETWWQAMMVDLRRFSFEEDQKAVAEDLAGGKVEIVDWPQSERDKLRGIAQEAWKSYADRSELAREAYEAHLKFMKSIGLNADASEAAETSSN